MSLVSEDCKTMVPIRVYFGFAFALDILGSGLFVCFVLHY